MRHIPSLWHLTTERRDIRERPTKFNETPTLLYCSLIRIYTSTIRLLPNTSYTRLSEMLPILRTAFARRGSSVMARAARPMSRTRRPYATASQQGTNYGGDLFWIIGSIVITARAVCPLLDLLYSYTCFNVGSWAASVLGKYHPQYDRGGGMNFEEQNN